MFKQLKTPFDILKITYLANHILWRIRRTSIYIQQLIYLILFHFCVKTAFSAYIFRIQNHIRLFIIISDSFFNNPFAYVALNFGVLLVNFDSHLINKQVLGFELNISESPIKCKFNNQGLHHFVRHSIQNILKFNRDWLSLRETGRQKQ